MDEFLVALQLPLPFTHQLWGSTLTIGRLGTWNSSVHVSELPRVGFCTSNIDDSVRLTVLKAISLASLESVR